MYQLLVYNREILLYYYVITNKALRILRINNTMYCAAMHHNILYVPLYCDCILMCY